MEKQCKILVLTDSALPGSHEGIYPVLQSLIREKLISSVCVCDRNDDENAHFYRDRIGVGGLHVFEVDEWYAYETRHAHMNRFAQIDESALVCFNSSIFWGFNKTCPYSCAIVYF